MKIYTSEPGVAISPVRYDGSTTFIVVFLSHIKQPFLKNFRCINCGKIVFQYTDRVTTIIDSSDTPPESATLEIMCERCKIIYKVI